MLSDVRENVAWACGLLLFGMVVLSPVVAFGAVWLLASAYVGPLGGFLLGVLAGVLMFGVSTAALGV